MSPTPNPPRVSLDQWRTLLAVVDQGGFAQAAAALHRSQSAVSYAVARLQARLGVTVLQPAGRRMVLTEAGEVMVRRARRLVREAADLETLGRELEAGWEAEIRLVVDAAFPSDVLLDALQSFAPHDRGTRVQMREVVLSGAAEALQSGTADLVIGAELPGHVAADVLLEIELVAVAHADHPLHRRPGPLEFPDLESELQLVIQDSGTEHAVDRGWLGAEHRWTVSSIDRAVATIRHGLGFAWLPRHHIRRELASGLLKPLPLVQGQSYRSHLYLSYGRARSVGPATRLLARHLKEAVARFRTDPSPGP